MQTVKTVLTLLISIVLLGACGLKGPLYLEEDPVTNPATNQELSTDSEKTENSDSSKKKKTDPN